MSGGLFYKHYLQHQANNRFNDWLATVIERFNVLFKLHGKLKT